MLTASQKKSSSNRRQTQVTQEKHGLGITAPGKLAIKSKIWIEDNQGSVVFGSGRLLILNAIEKHGSILAAAKELNMSYRAVWGKIKATEERLGQPLLKKRTGGIHGGGSELTSFGKALVDHFRHLDALARASADTLFRGFFVEALTDKDDLAGGSGQ